MSWPHLHIVIVHVPVFLLPIGVALALIGRLRRSPELERAGLVALLLAAVIGLLAFASGQRSEDVVKELPGVESTRIERHEEGAQTARIGLLVLGVASLATLFVRRDSSSLPWLIGATSVLALVTALLVARTANLGGEIRHQEIRAAGAAPAPAADDD